MTDATCSVLLALTSPAVRESLARLLDASGDSWQLVGLAGDAPTAVELGRLTRPDVALVDVDLPGGGPGAVTGLRDASPGTGVLAWSPVDRRDAVAGMVAAGAVGYLLEGTPSGALLRGLRSTAAGGVRTPTEIADHLLRIMGERAERDRAAAAERLARRRELRPLLDPEGTTAVFQPIRHLLTGAVAGYEALARFAGGRRPDLVLAEAHAVGVGVDLELHAATLQVEAFRRSSANRAGAYLAVNASLPLLASGRLADVVRPTGLERRVLEVTDRDPSASAGLGTALTSMRHSDVRVAIDDSGGGLPGVRRILELRPDILKVDGSLVRDLHRQRPRRALVAGLAAYCNEAGILLVAEGIEQQAELDVLRDLGVSHGQGYLLGEPGAIVEEPAALAG